MDEIFRRLLEFRDVRGWGEHHTPSNLATALSIEAAELQELFLWGREPDPGDITQELADVLIYAFYLCNALDVDPLDIVNAKIDRNDERSHTKDGFLDVPQPRRAT